jgi:isoquinoline 1-oxidoreductase beta subunit
VERPRVFGGKVKSCDDKNALRVRGVHQSVAIPPFDPPCAFQALGGVAVILITRGQRSKAVKS